MTRILVLLALAPVLAGCFRIIESPPPKDFYTDYGREWEAAHERMMTKMKMKPTIHPDVIADGYTRSVGEGVVGLIRLDHHECDHLLKIRDAPGYREAVCEGVPGLYLLRDSRGNTRITKVEP